MLRVIVIFFGFVMSVLIIGVMATSVPAIAHKGATGIIKERMDEFSNAKQQMKALRAAIAGGDLDKVAQISDEMKIWGASMQDSFPIGSDTAPSQAAPTIWTDKEGFNIAVSTYAQAIDALTIAALSQDTQASLQAFGALGAACSGCHKGYRK